MSGTRTATDGLFHQERFCSSPELSGDAINGFLAAKRIGLIRDQSTKEVLWWIQSLSLKQGALQELYNTLVSAFPERIGPPTLHKLNRSRRRRPNEEALKESETLTLLEECGDYGYERDEVSNCLLRTGILPREKWHLDYYKDRALEAISDLPERLKRFCLDPEADISEGVWYFKDLLGALRELRQRCIDAARAELADTSVSRQILDEFGYFFSQRQNILILGQTGLGKSTTARVVCDMSAGMCRRVEVPGSNDDRSFYVAIARPLGVARGSAFNTQQIKLKVEETLDASGLMLVLDESQYLWPQTMAPRSIPARMLWIKSISDAGTPIALIGLDKFLEWQELYVRKTLWPDGQFERRFPRRLLLPTRHTEEDLLKIARVLFPEGDVRSWKMLAGLVLVPLRRGTEEKARLVDRTPSAMKAVIEKARYRAKQAGRRANFDDIKAACDEQLGTTKKQAATHQTGGEDAECTAIARPEKRGRKHSAKRVSLPRRNGAAARLPINSPDRAGNDSDLPISSRLSRRVTTPVAT